MCGIFGVYRIRYPKPIPFGAEYGAFLEKLCENAQRSFARGIDTFGAGTYFQDATVSHKVDLRNVHPDDIQEAFEKHFHAAITTSSADYMLFNFRGVPTTEALVKSFGDNPLQDEEIQPFFDPELKATLVHNGIIANDKELSQRKRMIHPDYKHDIDSYSLFDVLGQQQPQEALGKVNGSYAVLHATPDLYTFARSYLGLYVAAVELYNGGVFLIASSEPLILPLDEFVIKRSVCFEVRPYHSFTVPAKPGTNFWDLQSKLSVNSTQLTDAIPRSVAGKAIVVLSGGLDSTTCAYSIAASGRFDTIHLMHFAYGAKAQWPEELAVYSTYSDLMHRFKGIRFNCSVEKLDWMKALGKSTLTDDNLNVTVGERGAETVSEWVPARNLVMMSYAAAYSDAHKFDTIVLGLNREEASVFGDNSTEFYHALNKALDFGTISRVQVYCPLSNMMKHHIVREAQRLGVPLINTWSCYKACSDDNGEPIRCGECGPCTNTRRALLMAGIPDPFVYYTNPDLQGSISNGQYADSL